MGSMIWQGLLAIFGIAINMAIVGSLSLRVGLFALENF